MRFAPALELSEDSISLYERRRRSRRRDSPSSRHVLRRFDRHVALTEGRRSWRYFEIPGPRLFSIQWGFVCRKSAQIPRSPGDGPPAGELSVHKALNSPEPIGRAWLGDLETFHAVRRCYRASSALHCPEQENVRSQASSRQPKRPERRMQYRPTRRSWRSADMRIVRPPRRACFRERSPTTLRGLRFHDGPVFALATDWFGVTYVVRRSIGPSGAR